MSPELIYYDREETTGPKLSSYDKCEVPANLESVLTSALGTWGVVKKVRTLIMVGQTRVHFDSVEGLGNFVELEVSFCTYCRPNINYLIYILLLIIISGYSE